MRHPAFITPRRLAGPAARIVLALAVAAIAGCGERNPTDPTDTGDEPAASLGLDGSPSASAEAATGAVAAVTRLPRSFFVDPRIGSDANSGTKLKPFKTLAHGLGLAISGDTLRLASGVYSKATNGEKFSTGIQPVTVPAGVTIIGTLADDFTSRLQGGTGDTYGLDLKGGATVRNLVVSGFPAAIRALGGTQTFKTLVLDQNSLGLDLRGSAKTTLSAGSRVFLNPRPGVTGMVTGANLSQQAQLTVVGGGFTGAGENCRLATQGVVLNDASRLSVNGRAELQDIAGSALVLRGTSKATVTRSIIARKYSVVQCTPLPSVLAGDSAAFTLKSSRVETIGGSSAVGIHTSSRALLTLDSAQVTEHSGVGIKAVTPPKILVQPGTLINGNTIGIQVLAGFANLTITGATISSNDIGIAAPFLKLRNSKVAFNATGIVLTSGNFIADLGLSSAPGNNVIKDNSITGVRFDVLELDAGGTVDAAGNSWNPSIQGADASGHYSVEAIFGPNQGKNFQLTTEDEIFF